ncbi:DNA-binding transcriptional regulator, PadR family [Paenibacillus sp. 1_12]|uniref:PadR family transcriptional regulator n=1 Tax=Paenibacillus sp. 1_12 TaxID=1566278 RepID=UPI0008F0ADDB|nr:PadR family transcriptional regulator [Paenibacillus sp. 1_12]SFL59503.1 DNA-binding transcriptional regulator, PadR family [Paenibacillus sp. 1_12]
MKFKNYRNSYQGWQRFGNEDQEMFSRHHRDGSRGGFGGRGEGKRRFFERGEFKYALLELLTYAPMHGYQLIKAMEEKTGGLYTPSAGSVYPNLQLLEDMNLIGFSDEDSKKLYHITDEGKEYLRKRERTDMERPDKLWERPGRHGLSQKNGKSELRELMKEWSEVIYLMAGAAKASQENPSSEQAKAFQELMTQFQVSLKEISASTPNSSIDDTIKPPVDAASLADDNGIDE